MDIRCGSRNEGVADLNRFWDGKPIHVDRRQSEPHLIDGVRLSVSLMIQNPHCANSSDRASNWLEAQASPRF